MFTFVLFLLFSAQSAREFFGVARPGEKSLLSSVSAPTTPAVCIAAYSLFASDKPFPQRNCMIVFIASKEADCCVLVDNVNVTVSHCRPKTLCTDFLAKTTRNVESPSQIRKNCRLVYSLGSVCL